LNKFNATEEDVITGNWHWEFRVAHLRSKHS